MNGQEERGNRRHRIERHFYKDTEASSKFKCGQDVDRKGVGVRIRKEDAVSEHRCSVRLPDQRATSSYAPAGVRMSG